MNRRFRLATVERLRQADVRRCTGDLGLARQRLAAAEQAIADLGTELAGCRPALTATPDQVLAAAQRREALRERAEQLEVAAGAARAALAEALAAWQRAQQRLRAVVTLHERHRAELAAQDARREQRLTDELAGALAARGGDQP